MREILFRAKRKLDGAWIVGDLSQHKNGKKFIKLSGGSTTHSFEVDENTICQYTGLTDKNGNKIWENDVVDIHVFHEIAEGYGKHVREKGVVCYDKIGMLSIAIDIADEIPCYSDILFQAEIAGIGFDIKQIGNIFDNPELLERN